jgi:hypothetical protein
MMQFYFPLPFMFMALISPFVGIQVGFKLATALGTFLLPFAMYFALEKLDYQFPTPILGAALTIPYLFYEGNTIWGGTIASTMAGEFAYSLSLPILLVFLALLYRMVKEEKFALGPSIALCMLTLAHILTLFIGLATAVYFMIDRPKKVAKRFPLLAASIGLGLCLSSFWLLPAALNTGFTTSYADYWPISLSLLTPTVIATCIAGAAALIYGFYKDDDRIKYITISIIACLALVAVGPMVFNTLNVRFLPIAYLFVVMLSAIAVGEAFGRIPTNLKSITALIFAGLILGYVFATVTFTPSWIQWNYSGFEGKTTWPLFQQINGFISHLPGDARVAFEHDNGDYNEFGSERAFELLPLFAGKSTIEGLYMQSTPSSPFIFYSQCEYSQYCSQPIPRETYPTFNLTAGTQHLQLWNVQYLIQDSAMLENALASDPDWQQIARFGKYGIYELKTNPGNYVVPVQEVVRAPMANWQAVALKWYASLDSQTIVFSNSPVPASKPFSGTCVTDENITQEQISFDTNCIGTAHLIKISYYPDWQVVTGASQVYLASPSMMLVYPTQRHVVIAYERSWPEYMGIILTALAAVAIIAYWYLTGRKKGARGLRKANARQASAK